MRVHLRRLRSNFCAVRAALLAVFAALLLAAFGHPLASADPTPLPPPRPVYPPNRPMPADPPRTDNIGGARVASSAPQGEGNGTGPALAAARERGEVTVPVWAYDGIHLSSSWPMHNIVWHLPGEMTLAPAAWTGDGGAVYASPDVDYLVRPYAGSGADIVITRKTVFSSSTIPFGLRLPEGSHLRQGVNAVLVESDASPGHPASTIATVSIPTATDANGVPLQVTPRLGPGFPQGQQNVIADLGPANPLAFPVTITIAYRPGELPTTGALNPDWQGMPEGASPPKIVPNPGDYVSDPEGRYRPASVDPVLYRQQQQQQDKDRDQCTQNPDIAPNRRTLSAAEDAVYQALRGDTPDKALRDRVIERFGPQPDGWEADHVVPVRRIVQIPGFLRLSPKDQLEVVNLDENVFPNTKRYNASRRDKLPSEWPGVKSAGDQMSPEEMQQWCKQEKVATQRILEEIAKRRVDSKTTPSTGTKPETGNIPGRQHLPQPTAPATAPPQAPTNVPTNAPTQMPTEHPSAPSTPPVLPAPQITRPSPPPFFPDELPVRPPSPAEEPILVLAGLVTGVVVVGVMAIGGLLGATN